MTAISLDIAIVGGSITGCAAAIALARAGHRVTVFERSTGTLRGRGAGIATPPLVIQSYIERDMVDADLPCFHVKHIAHIGRTTERTGRTAWVTPISIDLLNWADLYTSLRSRVPDAHYHKGREVATATIGDDQRVHLRFTDDRTQTFDLVVFADGYRSLGRRLVCPDAALEYRGYVLWRGVVEESTAQDSAPLEGTLNRLGYADGHAVMFLVPGPDRSIEKGKRWINWGCYIRVSKEELPRALTDRDGRQHFGSLPPGSVRVEEESRLKQMARDVLPPYFADIIDRSSNTFLQAIYTAPVTQYHRGRMCLAGDAGAFIQPFTATGVFKGMRNAVDLASALSEGDDIDRALERWSGREAMVGARSVYLGRKLESALIWSIPDFAHIGADALQAWWHDAAKLPENLFPPSDT